MNGNPPMIGIVTALEMERGWIGSTNERCLVDIGGMGRARAEAATTRLLDRGATAIVSWGIAGGLDPELEPGTVVIPEFVVDGKSGRLQTDVGWRDRLLAKIESVVPSSSGPMFHADGVVTSPARKNELHERWGAVAVDMESAGVAGAAQDAGVPWLVVRVVGDVADQALPKAVTQIIDENGRLRAGAVVGLVLRPRLWLTLIALGRANAAAGRSMRRVWAAAAPDLALGEDTTP
jgi:adenosylhomocysteine nucleosidase